MHPKKLNLRFKHVLFFSSFLMSTFSIVESVKAVEVQYNLEMTQGSVNLSGEKNVDFAIKVNGTIPAPTLYFEEGDDAVIVVKNQLKNENLSVHWHGLLLPPEMDGVPYVNTPPILPGESFEYRFRIRQTGTYWYHSHTGAQEQRGVYGAIVIYPKSTKSKASNETVAVLSDWTDENPEYVLGNLRKDGDYYQWKKKTVRSYYGAFKAGALKSFLDSEWSRMGAMDLSDVGYDAFLINGKRQDNFSTSNKKSLVKVRLINASASTYFYISTGKQPFTVVAADGQNVVPVETKQILIGMAETYDILVQVPDGKSVELRATAQDGTGFSSLILGDGEIERAPDLPKPDLYMNMQIMNMSEENMTSMNMPEESMSGMNMGQETSVHAGMPGMSMTNDKVNTTQPQIHEGHDQKNSQKIMTSTNAVRKSLNDLLTYDDLKSPTATQFSKSVKIHDVALKLQGNMRRYTWLINGKAIFEDRNLIINQGDIVRFTFINETMMHHPMHLHGHFFRVVNKEGESSPLKHTVDVAPSSEVKIEFLANEPGEWMLHCHNLYHLKAGMARVVKYSSFTPTPIIQQWQKNDPHNKDHWYFTGSAEVANIHGQGSFRAMQTWNEIDARIESRRWKKVETEGDIFFRRWLSNNLNILGGGSLYKESVNGVIGIGYLLPLLIESDLLLENQGKLRLDLLKKFQWTSHFFSDLSVTYRQNQKTTGELSLMYAWNWSMAAGFKATEDEVGIGVIGRF